MTRPERLPTGQRTTGAQSDAENLVREIQRRSNGRMENEVRPWENRLGRRAEVDALWSRGQSRAVRDHRSRADKQRTFVGQRVLVHRRATTAGRRCLSVTRHHDNVDGHGRAKTLNRVSQDGHDGKRDGSDGDRSDSVSIHRGSSLNRHDSKSTVKTQSGNGKAIRKGAHQRDLPPDPDFKRQEGPDKTHFFRKKLQPRRTVRRHTNV